MASVVYSFGDYVLNPSARLLERNGVPLNLSSKAFDILIYLVSRHGSVVTKSEIMDTIWSESFVEENNLAVHISALRRTIDNDQTRTSWIKTVSGRGYSFVGDVNEHPSYKRSAESRGDVRAKKTAIALLPFDCGLESNEAAFLSAGISRLISKELAVFDRVRSVVGYNINLGDRSNLSEIGFLNNVEYVLDGAVVQHREGPIVSVTLHDVAKDNQILGETYKFSFQELPLITQEIATAIDKKLCSVESRGDKKSLRTREVEKTEVVELCLKGNYILDTLSTRGELREDLNTAANYFSRASKLDPRSIDAKLGIAQTYVEMFHSQCADKETCVRETDKAVKEALDIDPSNVLANTLKGISNVIFHRNLKRAKSVLELSVALDENSAESLHWLSFVNICIGDFETALDLEKKALALNPTSIRYNNGLLRVYYFSCDYYRAIIQAEELLTLDSRSVSGHFFLAIIYSHLRLFTNAIKEINLALELRDSPDIKVAQIYVLGVSNRTDEARQILQEMLSSGQSDELDQTSLATAYCAIGDYEKALQALDLAYLRGDAELLLLKVNPKLNPIREDDRLKELISKLFPFLA